MFVYGASGRSGPLQKDSGLRFREDCAAFSAAPGARCEPREAREVTEARDRAEAAEALGLRFLVFDFCVVLRLCWCVLVLGLSLCWFAIVDLSWCWVSLS